MNRAKIILVKLKIVSVLGILLFSFKTTIAQVAQRNIAEKLSNSEHPKYLYLAYSSDGILKTEKLYARKDVCWATIKEGVSPDVMAKLNQIVFKGDKGETVQYSEGAFKHFWVKIKDCYPENEIQGVYFHPVRNGDKWLPEDGKFSLCHLKIELFSSEVSLKLQKTFQEADYQLRIEKFELEGRDYISINARCDESREEYPTDREVNTLLDEVYSLYEERLQRFQPSYAPKIDLGD